MNNRGAMIAALLCAIASAGTASAETRILARSESWSAFGGTTLKGVGVCGISGSPGKRYIGLKLFAGDDTFTIQMQVPQVADGTKVPLTLRMDANPAWAANGTGFHFNDGDGGLEVTVRRAEAQNFVREFKNSSTMVIETSTGIFPRWVMGLEGTLEVSNAFETCIRAMK